MVEVGTDGAWRASIMTEQPHSMAICTILGLAPGGVDVRLDLVTMKSTKFVFSSPDSPIRALSCNRAAKVRRRRCGSGTCDITLYNR